MDARIAAIAMITALAPTIALAAPDSDSEEGDDGEGVLIPTQPSRFAIYFGDGVAFGPTGHRLGTWNEMHLTVQVRRWSLGIAGALLVGDWHTYNTSGKPRDVSASYGGARVGYAFVHRTRYDVGVDGFVGAGEACLSRPNVGRHESTCSEQRPLLVVSPRVYASFRLASFLRMSAGLGYRFVNRNRFGPHDQLQFSGPYAGLTFEFGAALR